MLVLHMFLKVIRTWELLATVVNWTNKWLTVVVLCMVHVSVISVFGVGTGEADIVFEAAVVHFPLNTAGVRRGCRVVRGAAVIGVFGRCSV